MKNTEIYGTHAYVLELMIESSPALRMKLLDKLFMISRDEILDFVTANSQGTFRQFQNGIIFRFQHTVISVSAASEILNSVTIYNLQPTISDSDKMIVDSLMDFLSPFESEPSKYITWAYRLKDDIQEATLPLKTYGKMHTEFYPFLDKSVDDFLSEFHRSKSSVLILNGPMGTGKSSLIRYYIEKFSALTLTTYDSSVMNDDVFYARYIGGDNNLLVLEDADLLLLDRVTSQNEAMSKLLNISDGIVDTSKKKMIFTANLENAEKIDPALMRPGRCFDIVDFRDLSHSEAKIACEKIGIDAPSVEKSHSLAEIFAQKTARSAKRAGFK